jgi:phosphohistidine phosphatase SixA
MHPSTRTDHTRPLTPAQCAKLTKATRATSAGTIARRLSVSRAAIVAVLAGSATRATQTIVSLALEACGPAALKPALLPGEATHGGARS